MFAAPARSSARSSRGDFDVALFSWSTGSPACIVGPRLRLRRDHELHRLLPAARHRPPRPGRQDPRRASRARVLNRADRGLASDVPTIPLFQFVFTARVRHIGPRLRVPPLEPSLERGELVARGVAMLAAIAVSLLAVSGAGGASRRRRSAAAPSSSGRSVSPACLPYTSRTSASRPCAELDQENVLAPAFIVRPTSHCNRGSSLVSPTRPPNLSLSRTTFAPRPAGTTASPSPHATSSSPTGSSADMRPRTTPSLAGSVGFRSRREDREGRPPLPLPGLAELLLDWSCRSMRSPGRTSRKIWTDGIDNPKTGKPIGSGPFLVQSWEPGKQMTLVRNPNYWGPHTSYLDRIVIRFCQAACGAAPDEVLERIRKGGRLRLHPRHGDRAGPAASTGTTVRLHRRTAGSTSISALPQAATPHCGSSSCARRSPTASTARRSSSDCGARSIPRTGRFRAP